MKLKKVKTRVLPHVSEDGTVRQQAIAIMMSTSDPVEFYIALPEYVSSVLGKTGHAKAPALEDVVHAYCGVINAYVHWVRNAKAERVLVVYAQYKAIRPGKSLVRRNDFGLSARASVVSLHYESCFRVGDAYHRERDGKVGERFFPDRENIVLPHSQVLEHNLRLLVEGLTSAIYKLDELLDGDAASNLLAHAPNNLLK